MEQKTKKRVIYKGPRPVEGLPGGFHDPQDYNHSMLILGRGGLREQRYDETNEQYAARLKRTVARLVSPSEALALLDASPPEAFLLKKQRLG